MRAIATEIKFSVIYVLAATGWAIGEYLFGFHTTRKDQHETITWFFFLPAFLIFLWALRAKRASLGGSISFRQGFFSGLIMTGLAVALSPLAMPVYFKLINPGFFEDFRQYAVAKGMMSPAGAAAYFNYGNYMLQGAIGNLLLGVLFSLLAALIVRRKAA